MADRGEITVIRGKNRLTHAFDSSTTGGYRDILINIMFNDDTAGRGHIAELQLSIEALYEIKMERGHKCYKIGRFFSFFEPATCTYRGGVDAAAVDGILSGSLADLELDGSDVSGSTLDEKRRFLAKLLSACYHPCSRVRTVSLSGLKGGKNLKLRLDTIFRSALEDVSASCAPSVL